MTRREAQAWRAYRSMQAQLASRIARDLARSTGLSEADYEVLLALDEAEQRSMRALALRCQMQWEKSRLSHQLRRMEERGLVTRKECAEDSRGTVICLTRKGSNAVSRATDRRTEAVRTHFLERLSRDQLTALTDISTTLLDSYDAESSHSS